MGRDTAESSGGAILILEYSWEDSDLHSDLGEAGASTLQTDIEDLREARRDGGNRIWEVPGGEPSTQKLEIMLSAIHQYS